MYGENEVNDHHLLKYSLLYDFFHYFSSLNVYGIPVTACLQEQFFLHIQPFVDSNLSNTKLIRKLRKQHKFQSMGDIRHKLLSVENNISQINIKKNKNSILLAEVYSDFAKDQLKEYEVTMYGYILNELDNLPNQFQTFKFRDELAKVNAQSNIQQKNLLKKQVNQKLKISSAHYYFGTPQFREWFVSACLSTVTWVYIMNQLVMKTKPAVIIEYSEAGIFRRIISLLSKKYNIPFINMPLLIGGEQQVIPSRADHYLVWGNHLKNYLLDRKVEQHKITETGNVKFYYEMRKSTVSKKAFYNKFNLPSDHRIMTFTTQPLPEANKILEKWLNAIPNTLPLTILIRKHKNDQYSYPLLTQNKNIRVIDNNYPLYDLISNIDCLMTISSNTAIEAALFAKPLLILQPTFPYDYKLNNNQYHAHLAKAQAGQIIKNARQLVEAVQKFTADPGHANELRKKGNQFLAETLITVEQAPMLAKKEISEIILKHL